MKKPFVLAVAAVSAAAVQAHVLDDAKAWYRGAADGAGDGVFTDGRGCFRDVLHAADATHANHAVRNAAKTGEGVPIRVESLRVRCPYRNETLEDFPCLTFPVPVETNSLEEVDGVSVPNVTVKANGLVFPDLFKDYPGTGACSNYTAVLRVRYDSPVNNYNDCHAPLISLGFAWTTGADVGLALCLEKDDRDGERGRYMKATVGNWFLRDSGDWFEGDAPQSKGRKISAPHIPQGRWIDLAVAVDGRQVTVGYTWDDSASDAVQTNRMVRWWTFEMPEDHTPAVRRDRPVKFGYEELGEATFAYGTEASANPSKLFRGVLQQFALWHRTLSKTEMLEAFAGSRPSALRIGLDGRAKDVFTRKETSVDANARWEELDTTLTRDNPAVTVRFRFALETDATVSQLLRIKLANDSASGRLAVTVNGKAGRHHEIGIEPQHAGFVLVPAKNLQAGENTLTVTRTDGGDGSLVIETLELGGGWQRGLDDGHGDAVFEMEGVSTHEIDLADGNLKHFKRGYLGGNDLYSKEVIRFRVPAEIAGKVRSSVYFRTAYAGEKTSATYPFCVRLNGEDLLPIDDLQKNTGYSAKIPPSKLRPGENVLEFGAEPGAAGYVNNACWRFQYDGLSRGALVVIR